MAFSKLKTIILRFRDLSVPNTIERHKEICHSDGYVWWGWWSKPQETVPLEAFGKLLEECRKPEGLEILLFDSGNKRLYTAVCEGIKYDPGKKKIESPENSKTPAYYAETQFLAWFKLRSIGDPLPNGEALKLLRNYSYYRINEFFVSGQSPYAPFYDKRVYSLDELFDQQRTIWFIKEFSRRDRDRSHEIHSFSFHPDGDKNVDASFRLLRTPTMLWLSDLHFSEEHHAFKAKPASDDRLQRRLLEELNRKSCDISHVILSGDLTFQASKEEFSQASEFIQTMNSAYDLCDVNYSICPGNHDLKFSEESYKEDDKVTVAFDESKEAYVDFYRQLCGADPTDSLYSIRRLLTPDMLPVEIISVNSCVLQQDKDHFRGLGYVGNDQLREIEGKLSLTKDKNVFRILVMHHHLIPVIFSEEPKVSEIYSLTLDSEAISQFVLRNRISVVLHGHTHKGFYSEMIRYDDANKEKKKYYIVGIGSAGAKLTELSDGASNMFGLLTFQKDRLEVSTFSLNADRRESKPLSSYSIPYCETNPRIE